MGWREARAANDGFTWSEQYRHECEVRMVAAMMPRERRLAYLDGVQKVRGQAARDRLERDLVDLLRGVA